MHGCKAGFYVSHPVRTALRLGKTYMYKCCRDDDTGTELLHHGEDGVKLVRHEPLQKDGTVNTQCARRHDDEEQSNTQRDIVVPVRRLAS